MMTTLRALVIAFSMYSQIPMPQFTWQDKEMKYAFCFFPWVGAAIGGITMFWWWFCGKFSVGNVAFAMIGTAIPLAVTGGFHVDGFMDTMDAFHSYQPREKKLEILKDSHIGAFSVICLVLYELIYIGAYSEIDAVRQAGIVAAGFFLSRCLSGIAAMTFPVQRKKDFCICSRAKRMSGRKDRTVFADSIGGGADAVFRRSDGSGSVSGRRSYFSVLL